MSNRTSAAVEKLVATIAEVTSGKRMAREVIKAVEDAGIPLSEIVEKKCIAVPRKPTPGMVAAGVSVIQKIGYHGSQGDRRAATFTAMLEGHDAETQAEAEKAAAKVAAKPPKVAALTQQTY